MSADYLASGSTDSTINLWSLAQGTLLRTYSGHVGPVFCVQFDSTRLVSGGSDNTIRIWNLSSGVVHKVLTGHQEAVVCLQFDNEKVISGSSDKTIKVLIACGSTFLLPGLEH